MTRKLALITGGSRGIGRATALALASAGTRAPIHYAKSGAAAKTVADAVRKHGGEAETIDEDLSRPEGPSNLASRVRSFAGDQLDCVVLDAGISKAAPLEDHTIEGLRQPLRNQRSGAVLSPAATLATAPRRFKRGSYNFTGSSNSPGRTRQPNAPSLSAYAATKEALNTLMKHWAATLGVKGIRVNAVASGEIKTDMWSFTKTEGGRDLALNMQALKRIGQPDDVADVIAFLASDAARWITGASIPVDGRSKL